MTHAQMLRYALLWFCMAMAVEGYGLLGYAVHAGWVGLPGVVVGPVGSMRVLVLYDGVEQPINSTAVLHYLRTHCIKNGETAEYRQWHKDVDAKNESSDFQRLDDLPHESFPWVAIEHVNGHPWSGSLPKGDAEQLALFKKWGGE